VAATSQLWAEDSAAVSAFAGLYPQQAGLFAHDLSGHPLLTLAALAAAAARMDPKHVELRHADRGADGDFAHLAAADRAPCAIAAIADSGCWAMLRFAEQLPEYRSLMEAALAPFSARIAAVTGPLRDCHAFIFVSSDAMVTPFHCDAEYNILFQIAGDKSFRTFPAAPPFLAPIAEERMHASGNNLLDWHPDFADQGVDHRLSAGDALFVPYKAPHLVTVTRGPSISLSLTWKSDWSLAQDEAHRFNAAMRRIGLRPHPVPAWPDRAAGKALGAKLLRRAGVGT
jgi:hypothetical protein